MAMFGRKSGIKRFHPDHVQGLGEGRIIGSYDSFRGLHKLAKEPLRERYVDQFGEGQSSGLLVRGSLQA
jgi:hypothetical protein